MPKVCYQAPTGAWKAQVQDHSTHRGPKAPSPLLQLQNHFGSHVVEQKVWYAWIRTLGLLHYDLGKVNLDSSLNFIIIKWIVYQNLPCRVAVKMRTMSVKCPFTLVFSVHSDGSPCRRPWELGLDQKQNPNQCSLLSEGRGNISTRGDFF